MEQFTGIKGYGLKVSPIETVSESPLRTRMVLMIIMQETDDKNSNLGAMYPKLDDLGEEAYADAAIG